MSTPTEQPNRHPSTIAWDKWLASEDGSCAVDTVTLGLSSDSRKFLESRLNRAFMAGASTLESDKRSEILEEAALAIESHVPTAVHGMQQEMANVVRRLIQS